MAKSDSSDRFSKKPLYTSGLFRAFLCIGTIGALLYAYIDVQNEITKRRLDIPLLAKELREIKEKNTCLHYEIDLFESPEHLMELASRSEYAHLKQPMLKDVLAFQEAKALDVQTNHNKDPLHPTPSSSVLMGAKQ